MISRREFGKMAALIPLAWSRAVAAESNMVNSTIHGVRFGIESFSFHDLPRNDFERPKNEQARIPAIIKYMRDLGIGECEIMSSHVEPFGFSETGWWVADRNLPGMRELREKSRNWRLTVPMDYYVKIRKQFEDAGLSLYMYNINLNDSFTDEERDRSFEAASALGSKGITSSTTVSEARRLVPIVKRHQKMFMAMHNHCNLVDPDQFATPQSFEKALAMSDQFMVTLDLGHFVAGNNDPIDFIKKHSSRIVNVHIRDRTRNNGPNLPLGTGDTPIREVLRLIRDNKYPIRAYIEYEYGTLRPAIEEVQRCYQYCKDSLA